MSTIKVVSLNSIDALRKQSLKEDVLFVAARKCAVARNGLVVKLPRTSMHLLVALLSRGHCTMDGLIEAVYRDDASGGPEYARNILAMAKMDIVSVSTALGLRIGRVGHTHMAAFEPSA